MEQISVNKIAKVDEGLGLVFGWAIVSKIGGKPYVDTQNDHIPPDAMLKAATKFMKSERVMGDMHTQGADNQAVKAGMVVFMMPMTSDIAKAFGITTEIEGLMIAAAPDDKAVLGKFKSGEYTGFSIGGMVHEKTLVTAEESDLA